MFAEVAFPISSYVQFTYQIPDELTKQIHVGSRVKAPLGKRNVIGIVVTKSKRSDFKGAHKPILELVDPEPVMDKSLWTLAQWMSDYYFTPLGQVAKTILPSKLSAKYSPPTTSIVSFKHFGDSFESLKKRAPAQRKILEYLSRQEGAIAVSSLSDLVSNPNAVCRTLFEKELVDLEEIANLPDVTGFTFSSIHKEINFTHEQQSALDGLLTKLNQDQFNASLLHGVTGSGKTEIYIELVRQALKNNKTAILLLPEISLTPQIAGRFRSVFGDSVALWHSKLSQSARSWTWKQICSGQFKVAIGARSAVFAPMKDLGVIIIDEEQEHSFKQESPAPRYHARDIALMRGKINDALVVLSSATPSLESYYNHIQDKYDYYRLEERFGGAPYPRVRIVDMIKEEEETGKYQQVISSSLQKKIEYRLLKNEQVILLQNRRGFAPILRCGDCGFVEICNDCEVSLTYHSHERSLKCHFCGHETQDVPVSCRTCNSINMKLLGVGTQKVEDAIKEQFPDIITSRLDQDSSKDTKKLTQVLEQFANGEIHILIGTQMIAKGLDFENVTLVGIINGDTGLFLPDFRSGERGFQLIYQAAGRSGRRKKGEVMIQTYNAENPVLKHAAKLDQHTYYNIAMSERQSLNYPPFSWMIRIEVIGGQKGLAKKHAEKIVKELGQPPSTIEILGPALCYRERLRGKYRLHIMLRSNKTKDPNGDLLHTFLRDRLTQDLVEKTPSGINAFIDVNPISVL